MKLAISIPDDLYAELDACAKRLRVPRSRLIAEGTRVALARHAPVEDATAAWNAALAKAGQAGDEAAVAELRRRSKTAVRRLAGPGW